MKNPLGVSPSKACRLMGTATGIHVKRVNFSDPHGGKGPCDEKAATIKSSWLRRRFRATFWRTAVKLRHAVTTQSGHDYICCSIDDNDSQAAQEQETYSSARLAVLRQCDLLHPIVYDTLSTCSLYSSNQLSKLRVTQLRLTCGYYNWWTLRCYRNVKCPLIILIIYCSICYILFSYKLNLYWSAFFLSELFHLLYRLFRSCIIYFKWVLFKLLIIENARGFFVYYFFTFTLYYDI